MNPTGKDLDIRYLEIACFNADSARKAVSSGACSRIELCKSYSNGGTTPSLEDVMQVRNFILEEAKRKGTSAIPLHVMIRPRAGNFTYTEKEVQEMEASIKQLAPYADGFVLGMVTDDGEVDETILRRLVTMAKHESMSNANGMKKIVFHRAIDELKDPVSGIQKLAECGINFVLSSGGAPTAIEGTEKLMEMVNAGNACGVEVIVGGGVREGNIVDLKTKTGARWFHSAALQSGKVEDGKEEVDILIVQQLYRHLQEVER